MNKYITLSNGKIGPYIKGFYKNTESVFIKPMQRMVIQIACDSKLLPYLQKKYRVCLIQKIQNETLISHKIDVVNCWGDGSFENVYAMIENNGGYEVFIQPGTIFAALIQVEDFELKEINNRERPMKKSKFDVKEIYKFIVISGVADEFPIGCIKGFADDDYTIEPNKDLQVTVHLSDRLCKEYIYNIKARDLLYSSGCNINKIQVDYTNHNGELITFCITNNGFRIIEIKKYAALISISKYTK